MEDLIRQAFLHVDIIGPHVAEGHYDLIGPNNEIILPGVWETVVEPDWTITMHMWPMPEPKEEEPPIVEVPEPPPPEPEKEDKKRKFKYEEFCRDFLFVSSISLIRFKLQRALLKHARPSLVKFIQCIELSFMICDGTDADACLQRLEGGLRKLVHFGLEGDRSREVQKRSKSKNFEGSSA